MIKKIINSIMYLKEPFNKNKDNMSIVSKINNCIQSGHVNFLLGSGCSDPFIKPQGSIEAEIDNTEDEKKRNELITKYLNGIIPQCKQVVDLWNNKGISTNKNNKDLEKNN